MLTLINDKGVCCQKKANLAHHKRRALGIVLFRTARGLLLLGGGDAALQSKILASK